MKSANWFELKGQVIKAITFEHDRHDTSLVITTATGMYKLKHIQDCCESVTIVAQLGNIFDVLEVPITLAEEDCTDTMPPAFGVDKESHESVTYSTYTLTASSGTWKFLVIGESNGYYGETMSFNKII